MDLLFAIYFIYNHIFFYGGIHTCSRTNKVKKGLAFYLISMCKNYYTEITDWNVEVEMHIHFISKVGINLLQRCSPRYNSFVLWFQAAIFINYLKESAIIKGTL